jgi:Carboxypeptidase regulatory-like domain
MIVARPMKTVALRLAIGLSVALSIAACSGGAAPAATQPAASQPTSIDSPAAAAARVLAADARFAGLRPRDPNVIGQCCFYQVEPSGSGYAVTIEVGWGDCQAGCIDRHRWLFDVSQGGDVTLRTETGPPVPAGILVVPGGSGVSGGGGPSNGVGVSGIATAGPTCPVVSDNDPSCAARPVAGATVHIVAADGTEVATLTTDAQGRFSADLEPGAYRVVADDAAGLMHRPDPVAINVTTGVVTVELSYDTGIR